MNEQQLWNFFRQEVAEEECPTEYYQVFNGLEIIFEIVRYFNAEGIYPVQDGTMVVIKRPKRVFTRWEFEREISKRIQLMKDILEEKFRKEPIAMARALERIRGDKDEE